jgi:mono/diheme cytochrome c family protein
LRCTACHGDDLGGAVVRDSPGYARIVATNLTPGSTAGGWSDDQLATVLRHGVRPDGLGVRFMPSDVYQYLSRDDMRAVLSYLRSVPPVERDLPPTALGPLARVAWAGGALQVQPARRGIDHKRVPPARNEEDKPVAYGRYLGKIAGCTTCHGIYLSGGRIPGTFGEPTPSNLTPEGLAGQTRDDLARAVADTTHGMRLTDAEIDALWAWLATVPPRPTGNR